MCLLFNGKLCVFVFYFYFIYDDYYYFSYYIILVFCILNVKCGGLRVVLMIWVNIWWYIVKYEMEGNILRYINNVDWKKVNFLFVLCKLKVKLGNGLWINCCYVYCIFMLKMIFYWCLFCIVIMMMSDY